MSPDGRPFEAKSALVIVNPAAHSLPGRRARREVDEWLRDHGWRTEWVETGGPGDATALAARAAEASVPLVIVVGGDGTLNEAANGLAGTETALGTIPGGVTNLWAREVGLMKKPVEAVQLIAEGERRLVDLGRAGERYFMMLASFGIDAAVVQKVSPRLKGWLGASAYAVSAMRQALTYQATTVDLRFDGRPQTAEVLMVFCGNTQNYAGITKITPSARVDDGRLDVCVYQGHTKGDILLHAARTLLRIHRRSKKVTYRRVKRLELLSERALPLQLDGDGVADSPSEVTVAPGALWVAVPLELRAPIFSARKGRRQEEWPSRRGP